MVQGANRTAQMTVTSNTTLQQLNEFTQKLGGKEKLRGIDNGDGSITLYASKGLSGLWSRATGKAWERSQLARDAISMVMRKTFQTDEKAFDDTGKLIKLFNMREGKSMLGATLSEIVVTMRPLNKGDTLGLAQLPHQGKAPVQVLTSIANHLNNMVSSIGFKSDDPMLQREISRLGQELHTAVNNTEIDREYPDLKYSNGEKLKTDLFELLIAKLDEKTLEKIPKDELLSVVKQSVTRMLSELAPAQMKTLDTLTFNGKTYRLADKLGDGASGSVKRFVGPEGEQLAVKFPVGGAGEKANFLMEYKTHLEVQGEGHPNLLNVRGMGRTPDGDVFIVMDVAGKGTCEDLGNTMRKLEDRGIITEKHSMVAKLTIIKDMVEGMKHVHSNKMAHVDFKPQNVFIDSNGIGKVADFGNSDKLGSGRYQNFRRVDIAYWQAPEVLFAKRDHTLAKKDQDSYDRYETLAEQQLGTVFTNEKVRDREGFEDTFVPHNVIDNSRVAMIGDDKIAEHNIKLENFDRFALGVSMFNMVFGDSFILGDEKSDKKFLASDQKALTAFYEKGISPIGTHEGALRETTGDKRLDDLINGLMSIEPEKRPSLDEVLSSPVFTGPHIGSDKARELIVALADNDQWRVVVTTKYIDV